MRPKRWKKFNGDLHFALMYKVGQKLGPQTHDHNSVKSYPILIFFTERFLGKNVVKWILKIPPHHAYVAILPSETLMSAKEAINDKLQGSVAATYSRCSGIVKTKLRKVYVLLSLWVIFFKSVIIWQSYKQKRGCLVHALCAPGQQIAEKEENSRRLTDDWSCLRKFSTQIANRFIPAHSFRLYNTQGEVTSQNLRSRYDRHVVGITWRWCVELNGEDFWSCSHKIKSVSLRKCADDHWLTNKAYLS